MLLKTKAAERLIPIHPVNIALGPSTTSTFCPTPANAACFRIGIKDRTATTPRSIRSGSTSVFLGDKLKIKMPEICFHS